MGLIDNLENILADDQKSFIPSLKKDFQENFDWTGSFSFCDIGTGDVPWKETISALKSIQYKSTIIAEMLPWDETILSRTSVAMDQIFDFK